MFSILLLLVVLAQDVLPVVVVDRDNVEIRRSCRLEIPGPIVDADGNGVIQITGDAILVEGGDQHLHGGMPGQAPETFAGYGVRITGRRVELRNLSVSGYKGGIYGSGAHGLRLVGCDVSNNFRQRLLSTPEAENLADWLYPHDNDANEWLHKWGAGIYLEDSRKVEVRNCYARRGQNGLCLRAVHESRIYDNDFSFLSGWGVALYRSSDNLISHNALDFCIRGYSDGVYSRGQDSAGILLFEQCSNNVIGYNSATHGGDGFFGFGGRSALEGDDAGPGVGCNGNRIFGNDFSDSAANAIEITFSFDNVMVGNRLNRGNYGIWGGYSTRGLAISNEIEENRIAGIAVEHGHAWQIRRNRFSGNRRGVQLWWDDDRDLLAKPWSRVNPTDCSDHLLVENLFERDRVGIELRGGATASGRGDRFVEVPAERDVDTASAWRAAEEVPAVAPHLPQVPGGQRPVGARDHLRGRARIIMTPYGPYDYSGPFARRLVRADGTHRIEVFGDARPDELRVTGAEVEVISQAGDDDARPGLVIRPKRAGVLAPYDVRFSLGTDGYVFEGLVGGGVWRGRSFASPVDPREDFEGWRAAGAGGVTWEAVVLSLPFGSGGPSDLATMPEAVREAGLPRDGFGTLAETTVTVPPGDWIVRSVSDDGVRVWVDDELVIDNWTHHGPTTDEARLARPNGGTLRLRVAHFELDGFAVLKVALHPAKAKQD